MRMFKWDKVSLGNKSGQVLVVSPEQRLSWGKTISIGIQHVIAMFGATFLVPLLTGFPPATTLFFSAIATALFLLITKNAVPSYLGSSFAFIAPILAALSQSGGDFSAAAFGVLCAGIFLLLIGFIIHRAGIKWIDILMPPIVTGAIVAIIGFNLAPSAWDNFSAAPPTAIVTLVAIIIIGALFKNIIGKLSILLGVLIGYIFALFRGEVDFEAVERASWIGLPHFTTPHIDLTILPMFIPVVLVLVTENIGHMKSVAAMTGKNLDQYSGKAIMADGLGTIIAGFGGGSGTTTYAENIGVMASTKVYSTASYWVAAFSALALSLCPKFGEAIATIPPGVLGGATTLLYGMIGMLGVRIWVENKVDFSKSINITVAAVTMIIGIANFTFALGDITFNGIAIGTVVVLVLYHILKYAPAYKEQNN